MTDIAGPILVFGATGQQGGSVAAALTKAGWPVRALVRNPQSAKAAALRTLGVELVQGDYADTNSMRAAMTGAYGVFSVQPSSGQGPVLGISDEQEERYGKTIADLAVETGVRHLVYTSIAVSGDGPTGVPHFDTKLRIEAHIRTLPVTATIVRPTGFMDMAVMPGFGLDQGMFTGFFRPDQRVQLVAVEDIGKFVAAIFADVEQFGGRSIDLASDAVTGEEISGAFTEVAGRPIGYMRFPDEVLASNPFLAMLSGMFDNGRLIGHADLDMMRAMNPDILSFREWLGGSGRAAFEHALVSSDPWEYGNA